MYYWIYHGGMHERRHCCVRLKIENCKNKKNFWFLVNYKTTHTDLTIKGCGDGGRSLCDKIDLRNSIWFLSKKMKIGLKTASWPGTKAFDIIRMYDRCRFCKKRQVLIKSSLNAKIVSMLGHLWNVWNQERSGLMMCYISVCPRPWGIA